MQVHFTEIRGGKVPLGTKISIALGLIALLVFLFMFAFTAFLIALAASVLLFFLNLFNRRRPPARAFPPEPGEGPRPYRPPPGRNDDIIDI